MKIASFTRISRKSGGLFFSVRSLSQMIARTGIDQIILSPNDEFTELDLPLWNPLKVKIYPSFGPMVSSFGLLKYLEKTETNVVHCHGLWGDSQRVALNWQRKTGGSVVISPHGMLDPWAVRHSAWKKKLVGSLFVNDSLKKANCIRALCQSEVESIRAYGLKTPIAVVPNGVDLPAIDETIFRSRGGGNRIHRLLFLGRLHPKKGLLELLQAWTLILKSQSSVAESWQLIIAGWDDGGHQKGLQKQALDLGLTWTEASAQDLSCEARLADDANLVFFGPVFGEKKDTLLRSVDAFILPSFSEGLPMSILEAWSYGLPVLMTEFCNIPEGFKAGAAIQIAPDPESIAKGLDQLIALSGSDLYSLGSSGRRLVEQKFQWESIAQDMKSVYEWCLGGNKPDCLSCC